MVPQAAEVGLALRGVGGELHGGALGRLGDLPDGEATLAVPSHQVLYPLSFPVGGQFNRNAIQIQASPLTATPVTTTIWLQ